MTRLVAVLAALVVLPSLATSQAMSVSASSITLPAPDTITYDGGVSATGAVSVMVTACAGILGCRVTVENPNTASMPAIDVQWRLVSVAQLGTGDLGCTPIAPLLTWQALPASPVVLMETALVSEPGTACTAALEVRAVGVSYSGHPFTSPASTYWRDLLLRASDK